MVEGRGAFKDVLKGTNEEVRLKASTVEDAKKDLGRAYTKEQGEYFIGKIQESEHLSGKL